MWRGFISTVKHEDPTHYKEHCQNYKFGLLGEGLEKIPVIGIAVIGMIWPNITIVVVSVSIHQINYNIKQDYYATR